MCRLVREQGVGADFRVVGGSVVGLAASLVQLWHEYCCQPLQPYCTPSTDTIDLMSGRPAQLPAPSSTTEPSTPSTRASLPS